MTVKCKMCRNCEDGKCNAKKRNGQPISVSPNKDRKCGAFKIDPEVMAHEADKVYNKSLIPVYAPTWRYYASKKELLDAGELEGPKFIRINPNV